MSEARFGWLARMFLPMGTAAAMLLLFCVPWTARASAMQETPPDPVVEEQPAHDDGSAGEDEIQVTFSFKNQTWDEILDFFSRATGLPIVREVEPPEGTVTYIYPQPYAMPEALETLNILLQTQGVMLRREHDRLYLQKLGDMKRENIPTFVGTLPESVTDDQIVTVLVPLINAEATSVAEQLANLVAEYGSVTAFPKQNSIILVETAAQVRRITKIVDEIDREDVENIVEYIPIKYANAVELAKSLTALMGERVVEYVVDAKGKKVKIEDHQLPGLQITPDERTNAIIAKGTRSRIEKLKETIALLDVPDGGGLARTMRTIPVVRITPTEAAQKLQQFYASLPEKSRPVVVPLDSVDKITIVGDAGIVAEGVALLHELDEVGPSGLEAQVTELLPVTHATGNAAITAIRPMLGPRRERGLLLVPGPDQRSIIVSGPAVDVAQVRSLLQLIDRPAQPRTVKHLPVTNTKPSAIQPKLASLAERILDPRDGTSYNPPRIEAVDELGVLIVEADPEHFEQIQGLLAALDQSGAEQNSRMIELRLARAANVKKQLDAMFASAPIIVDGRVLPAPRITVVEPINALHVIGDTETLAFLNQYAAEIDTIESTSLRFFRLENARSETLAPLVREVLATRIKAEVPGGAAHLEGLLEVTADPKTNMLIVQAPESVMAVAEELVKQLDTGSSALGDPVIRVRPLTFADPALIAQSLREALPTVISKATGDPIDVKLIAAPGSNALILVGLATDLDEIDSLIAPLDERPAIDAIDAQTFDLEHADAQEIAPLVERLLTDQEQNDPRVIVERIRRSRGQFSFEPQTRVEADARTNSLIVSGPQQTVALARTLIEQLDRPEDDSDRMYLTYTPTNGDPTRLADTASRVLAATRPAGARNELELIPDPQTGVIVIVGPSAEARGAEAMLKAWDADSYVPAVDMKVVEITDGDARAIAATIGPLLADRGRWPQKLRAAEAGGLPVSEPRVSVEEGTNRLLVSAPSSLLPMAIELIKQLDLPPDRIPGEVRVHVLVRAKATDVAAALGQAIDAAATPADGPAPKIIAEPSSNSIVVSASPNMQAEIAKLIEGFDSGTSADAPGVRTVMLKHARAEVVAPLVEKLMNGEALAIEADSRLNAVIIVGPPALLAVAQETVEQLDVDPAGGVSSIRSVRVFAIDNADAGELAGNLRALFADGEDGQQPPVIQVDASSNALLVRATDRQFEMIDRVTGEIDDATLTSVRELRTIPIDSSRASAADVAHLLERMLERDGEKNEVEVITLEELLRKYGSSKKKAPAKPTEDSQSSRSFFAPSQATRLVSLFIGFQQETDETLTGDADVVIAVDPETNSLIVLGSPRAVARIRSLAAQAEDELPVKGTRIRAISLPEGVSPLRLRVLIEQTLRTVRPPGGMKGDLAQRVGVIADENIRSLVVTANDEDFKTVASLVAIYAQQPASEEVRVRSYTLGNVSANRAVSGLLALLGRGRGDRGPHRQLTVSFGATETSFDPASVRIVPDLATNTIIVLAPENAFEFVDKFLQMLDQEPQVEYRTIKTFEIKYADAGEMAATLGKIFAARVRGMRGAGGVVEPGFASNERINALVVTASAEQLNEVEMLLGELDKETILDKAPLQVIELASAKPSSVASVLQKVVVGDDQALRARTLMVPDDESGVLLVRADEKVLAEIKTVLAEIDRDSTAQFPVRSIVLERADAGAVAKAIQSFYDDRARIASGARGTKLKRQVAVVGDTTTSTLLVAASDADFEDVQKLIERLDSVEATKGLEFRVFPLKHAKADDVLEVLQEAFSTLVYQRMRGQQRNEAISAVVISRLNAILVTGNGEIFSTVDEIVKAIDQPASEGTERIVKVYPVRGADVRLVRDMVREALGISEFNWWNFNVNQVEAAVESDRSASLVIVSGTEDEQKTAQHVVDSINAALEQPDQQVEVIALQYAPAGEVARTLSNFLVNRADAMGEPDPLSSIAASETANTLLISATKEEMATLKDLIARIDLPEASGDRVIEILPLGKGEASEIARLVAQQFPRRSGTTGVIIAADVRTNSLIVNAPKLEFAQVKTLVEKLDGPPMREETIIRTFVLELSNAGEAMSVLKQTLALDDQGRTTGATVKVEGAEGEAVEVVARIVADQRSNTLVVAATKESYPVIEALIAKLEDTPSVAPIEYRIIPLKHAEARDVTMNLDIVFRNRGGRESAPSIDWTRNNQLVIGATPEQFVMIETILAQLDQPSDLPRITDFYPLKYAEADKVQSALSYFYGPFAVDVDDPAKKNVQIAADLATNSLVISADENEWQGIRALLEKLDSEQYDASLQLRVLPLTYADARSVARAINEAFRGPIERDRGNRRRQQEGDRDARDQPIAPTILVEAEEWVSAAAEEQTNSVVVSASRKNLAKIVQIVEQIDVADFLKMPAPRLITVLDGSPTLLAESLRELYLVDGGRGGMATRIVPDENSGTIIVRAEEEEFTQIKALADALQQKVSTHGLAVHILQLESASANRIVLALREAFGAQAEQAHAPLSIEADAAGNSIVVACTGSMWKDIESTIKQMDKLRPAAGQGIFIIDLEHVPAEEVRRVIEEIGLHQKREEGAAGRIVVEPVHVSTIEGRNAILVLANPADREVIVAIAKSLDSEPDMTQAQVRLVMLKNTKASTVVSVLESLFEADGQGVTTPIAEALQEQVRRLQVMSNKLDMEEFDVDLAKPIRLVGDDSSNILLVASSAGNVKAVEQLILMLDTLPVTEAATVRLFPLENISAAQFVRIVRELHEQGQSIGQSPGGLVQGIPAGTVGRALMESIALSIDERTNTVVAAGSEDSVAFVEILVQRLDTEIGLGWVEVKIIALRFADAQDVAELVDEVLVEGSTDLPASIPLQNQAARLRIMDNGVSSDSDVFVPMSRLVVRPDSATNSLIVVGTPSNIRVVVGLVSMMDVESAFPGALVRIYPLKNASATRLTAVLGQLFESQIRAGSIREEDGVEIIPDERTNAIVVSTTTRSFAVLEHLLTILDTRIPPEIREIKMVQLKHASAARIAPIIQKMMDARVERIREVQPEMADLEKVLVIADDRTNSIIVAAGNDTFETVRRLAVDLDEAPVAEYGEIVVVPVKSGAVDRLAQAIERIMERRYAAIPGDVARARRPLVLTDSRSSSLLVAADPEDLASIRSLVEQLSEVPLNPAIGLHVVPLDRGDVEQFAARLQALMRDRSRSLGEGETPTDEVSISADPVSRTLIIASNEENFEIVSGLVDALVRAGAQTAGMQDVDIVSLMHQDAKDVVELVEEMYVQDENRRRGETVIRISADERLNAVIINGPADDREVIKRLIMRLDDTRPSHVVEIKYIPLEAANAVETVSLIENVLSGNTLAGRRGSEQATIIRYLQDIDGEDPEVEGIDIQTEVSTAIRESISLTPDMRTNTVIVRAPRDAMALLERMIRDLDASSTGNQDIRVFKLTNADADAMAEILGDLFNLRQEGNLYVLKPREAVEVVDETGDVVRGEGALGTDLTLVPDQRQALSITVDSRTNSLLVSGTPTYLELVSDVVTELDAEKANERETFVYALRNAQAVEIARVISEFVAEDQRKLIETLGSDQLPSASRLLEREVTIVGEAKSNSVLVNASPRYRAKVMEMITELDIDPPQVMIQVLLAEITLDTGDQWGMTINDKVGVLPLSADMGFFGGILGGGVGSAFSIDANDLQLTLAAMESQRRFQLLSNPSITVANNEEGRIQVGETLRLPEAVATFETGIQNTTVTPEEVGTILTVLPTINPDGFVRMVISPEISKLSDKKLQISKDFFSPIIIRRTATTTVTVRDGETVVIGGLIKGDYERTDQKIPFLGDLPLIGALFRSEKTVAARTELLIVLTPHVIKSDSRRWKELTDDMIDTLPVPPNFQEQIREGKLDSSTGVLDGKFETQELEKDEG